MFSGRRGDSAVLINGVGAFCLHDGNHTQTGVIPDHCTLAGFHTVSIAGQCIGSVCVQRQRKVQRQTAVHVHQAMQFAQLELLILQDVQIDFRTGNGDGIGSGYICVLLICRDLSVRHGPDGAGNRIQDGGILRGVIRAVSGFCITQLIFGR